MSIIPFRPLPPASAMSPAHGPYSRPGARRSRFAHLLLAGLCALCLWATVPAFAQTPQGDGGSLIDDKKAL